MGERKVNNLLAAGAEVTVVSPALTDALAAAVDSNRFKWIQDSFCEEHLESAFLVVGATDDDELNAEIVSCASRRGVLVCDASSSERTQVIFGALHRGEENVTVAVFTDGHDPSAARRTRDRVAASLDRDRDKEGRSGQT